ncbi:MAG: helix-turn-helix domain-containing protein [Lachnospiraceae bacterium]|nr:helix-turn-helix domain-containing protein [Lachnospiraceae bacterium]
MNSNKNLTFDEFCKYINVGRNTGYKLLSSGQIKAGKIGKKWIIQKKEVDKFLYKGGTKNLL